MTTPVATVSLIDVLEAFSRTPQSEGNLGVVDALMVTGASQMARFEAMWDAEDRRMVDGFNATGGWLSASGIDILERHRFDERTRASSKVARSLLDEIEADMGILA